MTTLFYLLLIVHIVYELIVLSSTQEVLNFFKNITTKQDHTQDEIRKLAFPVLLFLSQQLLYLAQVLL